MKNKFKLLALALIAGGTMFAQPRISIGVGIGAPVAYPPPPAYAYVAPYPGPGYTWVNGYWGFVGGRNVWTNGFWRAPVVVAPRYYGGPRYFNSYRGYNGYRAYDRHGFRGYGYRR